MNCNRKLCFILLIIILSPIVIFFLYLLVNSFLTKTNTYYIPQMDIYVKTVLKPKDKFGYILIGNTSDLTLSDTIDYITVQNIKINNSLIVKPDNDTIWFYSQTINNGFEDGSYKVINKADKINQNRYVFINSINENDTAFFYKRYMTNPIIIKKPYIEISITEYFDRLLVKEGEDSIYKKIKPLD